MHMSREPQDDGYTQIPSPEKTIPGMYESDFSLTLESSSYTPKRMKTPSEVRSEKRTCAIWILFIFNVSSLLEVFVFLIYYY